MEKELKSGDIIPFIRSKDYKFIQNLGAGSFSRTVLIKDEIIDEILSYGIFEGDCPCSISGEELDCCENCQDDYKKCWLKYFKEKIQRDN